MAFSIRRTRELGTVNTSVPAGAVMPFAGNTSPAGWLLCFGQAISRTEYSALFSVLGTAYGTGDGSTTFALPDLRGRVVAGVDTMGGGTRPNRLTSTTITGGADALGEVGGGQTHTLVIGEMPAHTHTTLINKSLINTRTAGSASYNVDESGTDATSSVGGGGAHNNVQPTMVLNYIIKV